MRRCSEDASIFLSRKHTERETCSGQMHSARVVRPAASLPALKHSTARILRAKTRPCARKHASCVAFMLTLRRCCTETRLPACLLRHTRLCEESTCPRLKTQNVGHRWGSQCTRRAWNPGESTSSCPRALRPTEARRKAHPT